MGPLRLNVYAAAHFKRPRSSSRRGLYGRSLVPGSGLVGGGSDSRSHSRSRSRFASGGGADDTCYARSYIKEVKDTFSDQMEKYHMFVDVLKDFKSKRIDTAGVVAKVKDLFRGHSNLLLGFNPFLPEEYEITVNDEDEAPPKISAEFEKAATFVTKMKERFRNAGHVYKSFVDILCRHRCENRDINEVYHEVCVLLTDHPDLIDELTSFFPDAVTVNPLPPKRFPDNLSMQHQTNEKKFVGNVEEYESPREDEGALKYTYSPEPTFCEKVKERLGGGADYHSFLKYLHYYSNGTITRKELQLLVAGVLGKYPDLMEGFDEFIERTERVAGFFADDESEENEGHTNFMFVKEDQKKQECKSEALLEKAHSFLKKVKERFENDDQTYLSFLNVIKSYKMEHKSAYEIHYEVAKLLNDHPDLLDEFTKFLPDN